MENLLSSPILPKIILIPFLFILAFYLIIWGWKQYKYGVMHLMIQQKIGLLIIRKLQGREKERKKLKELSQPNAIKSQGRTMLLGGIFFIVMMVFQLVRLYPSLSKDEIFPVRVDRSDWAHFIFPFFSIYAFFTGWYLLKYKKLIFFFPLEIYLLITAMFQGPEAGDRTRNLWSNPQNSKKVGKWLIIGGILFMVFAFIEYIQYGYLKE